MLNGWIKIHRKILDHWVSSEPELFAVWIRLLAEANHTDTKKMFNGSLTEVKRGQLIFGLHAFSAKSGVSVAKLRRYLNMLQADDMINKQSASKYSLITITCFDNYQSIDKQKASKPQSINKQKASRQQHRENDNNEEECEEDNNGGKPPSCPHQLIVDLYHKYIPMNPRIQEWTPARQQILKARWTEKPDRQNIEYWEGFFQRVSKSQFLTGRTEKPFNPNLEWMLRPSNFIKIIEGNYDDKNNQTQQIKHASDLPFPMS